LARGDHSRIAAQLESEEYLDALRDEVAKSRRSAIEEPLVSHAEVRKILAARHMKRR
jgi:hypothetical protein